VKRACLAAALTLVSAAASTACSSEEERGCARVDELYAAEHAAGRTPQVGFSGESRDGCVTKLRHLKQGTRTCLSRCYVQAKELGGLFDCERTCAP
jgi:hypothetical protein